MQSMWLTNDHLYVLQITLVLMELASINRFWRLPDTIGNNMMKDLMDRNIKNRHVAYRQLVMWCWGKLGRHLRVVLPSCAVSCVRAHFPPTGPEEDHQFIGYLPSDN